MGAAGFLGLTHFPKSDQTLDYFLMGKASWSATQLEVTPTCLMQKTSSIILLKQSFIYLNLWHHYSVDKAFSQVFYNLSSFS